jgi:hypothetical protein
MAKEKEPSLTDIKRIEPYVNTSTKANKAPKSKVPTPESLIGMPVLSTNLGNTADPQSYNDYYNLLLKSAAQSPLGMNIQSIEEMLGKFKTSLLNGKKESEINMKAKTLLQQGTDVANRLTARINTAAQAANSPGAAAQTRRSQSLLG